MKEKIFNEKILKNIWIKWFLLISGMSMTIIMSSRGVALFKVFSVLVAFIIYFVILIKKDFIQNQLFKYKKYRLISAIFSRVLLYYSIKSFSGYISKLVDFVFNESIFSSYLKYFIAGALFLLAFSMMFILMNFFLNEFLKLCKNILNIEKINISHYIFISLFIVTIVFIVFNLTSVFYAPYSGDTIINFDVIFTTDSGNQVSSDVFLNINAGENDLRQPLFGVFAAPFAIFAKIISLLLFFLPNIYPVLLNSIQVILLLISFCLVGRMINLKGKSFLFFMAIIVTTYPTLLFSFNMEQYIFASFWLILFVYMSLENIKNKDVALIAATGSMLTTAIIFPIASEKRNFKEWLLDIFKVGTKAFCIITIFGQLPTLLGFNSKVELYSGFTGEDVLFIDRIYQFTNFVKCCFIKPETIIDSGEFTSYQLAEVTSLNILGVLIFAFVVLGFILNRKNKFAQISFAWVMYSILMLCIIGWGTAENGLILYSLYFAWAYIALAFMCIEKLFSKYKKIKYSIYIVLILILISINIPAIIEVVKFGIEYYPVR